MEDHVVISIAGAAVSIIGAITAGCVLLYKGVRSETRKDFNSIITELKDELRKETKKSEVRSEASNKKIRGLRRSLKQGIQRMDSMQREHDTLNTKYELCVQQHARVEQQFVALQQDNDSRTEKCAEEHKHHEEYRISNEEKMISLIDELEKLRERIVLTEGKESGNAPTS